MVTWVRVGHVSAQTHKESYRDRCSYDNRCSQWETVVIVNILYGTDKLQTGGYFRIIFIWKKSRGEQDWTTTGKNVWTACHMVRVGTYSKHDEENCSQFNENSLEFFKVLPPSIWTERDRHRRGQRAANQRDLLLYWDRWHSPSPWETLLLLESFSRLGRSW